MKYMMLCFLIGCSGAGPTKVLTFVNTSQISSSIVFDGGKIWGELDLGLVEVKEDGDVLIEDLDPSWWDIRVGQTIGDEIFLRPDADRTVVAHELGHFFGIRNHVDEELNPGCHVMNSSYCPVRHLTDADVELFFDSVLRY